MLCLAIIVVTWFAGWRRGVLTCQFLGISTAIDRALLAAVFPAVGLLLAVHLPALVAILTGSPVVTLGATTWLFAVLTVVFVAAMGRRSSNLGITLGNRQSPTAERSTAAHALRWPVAVVATTYLFFFIESLTRYPTGYDGLYYHLPTALHWVRSGKLDLVFGDLYHSLPENAMIIPFVLASAGWERAISWFNIPSGLIVLGCVYALARGIGAGGVGALAATCVAGSMPIVLFQTFSSYVDLYGAAAWMSALLALMWVGRAEEARARRGLLILAGLAAGIALGSKSTYLIHVALLLPIAAWIGYSKITNYELRITENRNDPRQRDGPGQGRCSRAVRAATVFGAAAMVCSAFWFIRGAVQAGNPLYPFGLTIGGWEILAGFDAGDHVPERSWSRKLWQWLTYPWHETNYAGTGYDYGVNNGLGAAYTALVPAAMLFVFLRTCRRQTSASTRPWLELLLILTLCAPLLLLTAFTEVLRYAFPLLLPAVVLTALLLDEFFAAFPRLARRMLTCALAVTCVVALLPPARALAGRVRSGQWGREWQYQVPGIINAWPVGSRVLFIGPPDLTFPFMGRGFRHEVLHEDVWRARYGHAPVDAAALERAEIDFVILRRPWPSDWGDSSPGTLIFDDSDALPLPTTAPTRIYSAVP